jgi:hypothetical protein
MKRFKVVQLAMLIIALGGSLLALVPAPVGAVPRCCGYAVADVYYRDSTYRTEVGKCTYTCGGDIICTGTKTKYVKFYNVGCCPCPPGPAGTGG